MTIVLRLVILVASPSEEDDLMTIEQILEALKALALEYSTSRSDYQGDYGQGYDTAKHNCADDLSNLITDIEQSD